MILGRYRQNPPEPESTQPFAPFTSPFGMVDQSKDVRTRRAISNSQRRALRKWFYDPADGAESTKTHADASAWWQREYNYVLNSSTVSEILSYKYDPLDGRNTSGAGPDPSYRQTDERKRQRAPKWGLLEEELMQWMFWYESMAGEGSVTGKMLKERAAEIWKATPSYQDLPTPVRNYSACARASNHGFG